MSVIRVAFIWPAIGWMGGVNYFSSLLYALHAYAEDNIKPIVFTGIHSDTYGLEAYVEVIRSPLLDKKSLSWVFSKSIKVMTGGRELLLKNLLDKHEIEVISHYNWLWKGCDIKTLSWIPDFQIMHLPTFFPEQERKQVVASITQAIQKSDAIAVINPSRFEGWSTTVEEAKAFEKKLILSDIEVHREQNPSRGLYFDIDNDEALANLLAESTVIYNRDEESHISKHAFSNKEYRMKEFAESYTSLIINLKQEA